MWKYYYTVSSIEDALEILEQEREHARIIAGGTDLVLELKNEQHPEVQTLVDITRIKNADAIWTDEDFVYFGPTVTHNQALVSDDLRKFGFPLVRAAYSVGAPQIRNVGTIVGNLVTASPANDTITPLIAMGASIKIRSTRKEYEIKLADFYQGVRKTALEPDEMIVCVKFPKMGPDTRGAFSKYLLRETHAISVANVCALLTITENKITKAVVTLGAVAPIIIRSQKAEEILTGSILSDDVIEKASVAAEGDAKPIDDIRGSKKYRSHLIPVLLTDALKSIQKDEWNQFRDDPVLLWGKGSNFFVPVEKTIKHEKGEEIVTTINNEQRQFIEGQNNTLINLIRDQAKLTGTKLGCGEGECGSCTMHLNGLPVLACLLPAPKAHKSEITTIEGLTLGGELSVMQKAFVDAGAVQCGYCTPGFIMSAVKLIEEKPEPTEMDIKQGLAGNICRCTGYYTIIKAVELAAERTKHEME
jgi:xanthine dehydrogenase iron-sulfur cluster and FAD-binding subunit A